MNSSENSTILAGVQNMSISELSAFSASMRRMLETMESIASLPNCHRSDVISELLDEEMDRFGQSLDMAAAELAQRVPSDDEEAEERTFGLTALACAVRMSLEDFVGQYQEGSDE